MPPLSVGQHFQWSPQPHSQLNSNFGPRGAVGNVSSSRCVSDFRSRGRKFDPGPVPNFRGDWSWFVCLISFFTSQQQSFSYVGKGLPGSNQYSSRIDVTVLAQGHNTVTPRSSSTSMLQVYEHRSSEEHVHIFLSLHCWFEKCRNPLRLAYGN